MTNGDLDNPQQAITADGSRTHANLDRANPYGVGVSGESGTPAVQTDLARYQTLRTALVLIISSHFIHIVMLIFALILIVTLMNAGQSLGGAVAGRQGAEVGGEIGGVAALGISGCCSWIFFIISAPLNFIGGCLGFTIPDITGAKSKIVGSVVASGLAILMWIGIFVLMDSGSFLKLTGLGAFGYIVVIMIAIFASHAFFVWALNDVGQYLENPEVCRGGFISVGLSGLCLLLFVSGLGLLLRVDGWSSAELPGSSSGMWILSCIIALAWLIVYITLLIRAMSALKFMSPPPGMAGASSGGFPGQPVQAAWPVSSGQPGGVNSQGQQPPQAPIRKGW